MKVKEESLVKVMTIKKGFLDQMGTIGYGETIPKDHQVIGWYRDNRFHMKGYLLKFEDGFKTIFAQYFEGYIRRLMKGEAEGWLRKIPQIFIN